MEIGDAPAGAGAGAEQRSAAVGRLFAEHHGWLLGWLRRKVAVPQDAADLVQDTFIRLLSSRRLADEASEAGGGAAGGEAIREPRALLTTIARGLVVDLHRRQALERAYLAELALRAEPLQPSVEERQLVLEALRQIDAMLDGLSLKARSAFLHSRLDGMTHAEIAQALGVSVSRVRQYLAQALRHFFLLDLQ
ncbi:MULTISPECIES: sigma-70 family RNA polymerase sigma factor [Cupriavidus]